MPGQFNRGRTATTTTTKPATAARGAAPVARGRAPARSRYAGVPPMQDRTPLLTPGTYSDLEVVSSQLLPGAVGKTETFQVTVKVIESDGPEAMPPGSIGAVINALGDQYQYGERRTVALCMACAGFDDPGDYAEFDPEGLFVEACEGKVECADGTPNPYAIEGQDSPLEGRHVAAVVTKGKERVDKRTGQSTGDYYRNVEWAALEAPIEYPE